MNLAHRVYRLHPKKYRQAVEREASYANFDDYQSATLTIGMIGVTLLLGIMYFAPATYRLKAILFALLSAPVYLVVPYMLFSVAADKRKSEMERMLPDALLLVSTNLKSGSSINRAFLASAREEFGPLQYEFNTTAVQISGGVPVETALDNMRNRINSPLFKDTLKVLTNAIEAGGNTAELLESSAEDIRSSLELRDEVKSSVRMYTVFIFIAAVVAAPALFGITVYMAETTTSMWSNVNLGQEGSSFASGGGQGMSFSKPDIDTEFLGTFSILALTISNFFASLMISQIGNGNLRGGAKLIPITVSVSVGLFIVISSALSAVM
jgi:Flp pilus assembly protein TadB